MVELHKTDPDLNHVQKKASSPEGGVTLVLAGAGTGKTKTLIQKISNIISCGKISPENILVLTFSRKAALEIDERLSSINGSNPGKPATGTFHSFCLQLLREHEEVFRKICRFSGFPKIFDEHNKEALIHSLIGEHLADFMGLPVGVIFKLLSEENKMSPAVRKKLSEMGITGKLNELKERYREHKRAANLIDFEDMIELSIDVLRNDQDVRKAVINQYRYILVDEFQDTSYNNFELLNCLLPDTSPNLFAVGDDWQSIYGFRDSRIEYIVNMKKYFPKMKKYTLDINYRSHREIVKLSNSFIRNNKYRTTKKLTSYKGKGGTVQNIAARNRVDECEQVKRILQEETQNSSDIAILYRNNWQGRVLGEYLGAIANEAKMMTMHASKGLEFDTVIITGVADDILPDACSDIEEERRLLYVALTRAKRKLYVIYHLTKNKQIPEFAQELGFTKKKTIQNDRLTF